MDSNVSLPPLPDGFEIQQNNSASTSGLPPLPDGFQIQGDNNTQEKPFYDALGASMTPEQKNAHPVLAGIEQTAQDIGTVAEKAANGLTLGGLDYGLKKANIQPPNFDNTAPENKSGLNLVGDVANMSAAGKTIGAIAKPVIAAATPIVKPLVKPIENAVIGTGRYFSRIKNSFNPENVSNLNVSSAERISNLARRSREVAQSDIKPIQDNINNIKNSQDSVISSIDESRKVLKDNVKSLHFDLQKSAENGALDFQKKLPDFFHANSEAYGSARDKAFSQMAQEGKGISNQEVYSAIQKTKQDIQEALIPPDAPAIKIINMLEKKYNPTVAIEDSPILSTDGNPISSKTISKANDFVNLDGLVQDLRNVKKSLSSGAMTGRTGFNQEDLAVAFLDDNLGNYIKGKIPAFAQLQKDYSPVIRAMKEAHKVFKPNQGEFNTLTATNFLKKAGTGKLEAGQEKMLSSLEEGNKFTPGVGKISQPVRDIGSNIDKIKNQINQFEIQKNNIVGKSQQDINLKRIEIENRKIFLQKRLGSLEKRRQDINRLESNKDVASKLKKAILGKAADSVGLGAISKAIR